MTAVEIVKMLSTYKAQVITVANLHGQDVVIQAASEYSFIRVEVRKSDEPFVHIQFQLKDDLGSIYKMHCDDPALRERLASESWPGWRSASRAVSTYSEEVLKSLETADGIAELAMNCTLGDNYAPGNFSTVSLDSQRIELRQVNTMNSRSLDHKNDYSLRSLLFIIPLDGMIIRVPLASHRIGAMMVEFTDRSSANKRACGEQIAQALAQWEIEED